MLSFQFWFRAAHIRFERRITFDSVGVSVAVEAKITAFAARFFTKLTSYCCLCHVVLCVCALHRLSFYDVDPSATEKFWKVARCGNLFREVYKGGEACKA